MRSSFLKAVLLITAAVVPSLAQNFSSTYVYDQSKDFNLVVQSRNKTLNGKLLGACHNGAAHEGMCIVDGSFNYSSDYVNWQHNTTRYICTETNSTGTFTIPCNGTPVNATVGETGILTWWLNFGGTDSPQRVSQAMALEFAPSTNVAQAEISFSDYGSGTQVAFDSKGLMNIQTTIDDRLAPGPQYLNYSLALYRWFICQTYYSGYTYTVLTWVPGTHSPQNPTCEKVNVKRVFV